MIGSTSSAPVASRRRTTTKAIFFLYDLVNRYRKSNSRFQDSCSLFVDTYKESRGTYQSANRGASSREHQHGNESLGSGGGNNSRVKTHQDSSTGGDPRTTRHQCTHLFQRDFPYIPGLTEQRVRKISNYNAPQSGIFGNGHTPVNLDPALKSPLQFCSSYLPVSDDCTCLSVSMFFCRPLTCSCISVMEEAS